MNANDRPTCTRYKVNLLLLLLTAITYLDRVCISRMGGAIRQDLNLSEIQLGMVYSAFAVAYALFEIPGGWLADRYGPRWMLARIVFWWSLMTAVTGLATGFLSLILIRLLFGMGEAGAFPGISRVYSRWLPGMARGRGFGLVLFSGTMAGALTPALVDGLSHHMNGRWVFAACAAPGCVWVAVWAWYFRDHPEQHRGTNEAERRLLHQPAAPATEQGFPWRALISSRNAVVLGLMYFGVLYGWYFYLTWFSQLVDGARLGSDAARPWLIGVPCAGLGCGVFLGGYVTDWLVARTGLKRARQWPGLVGLPLAALLLVLSRSRGLDLNSVWLIGAAAFCSALCVPAAWAVCLDIGRRHAGVVSGSMNMCGNLGGVAIPIVAGYQKATTGTWDTALLSMAGAYVMAAVCWIFIDAERPVFAGAARDKIGV